ncbi:MAG: MerR family transcriptional regulator [Clostridia bacterium]|nr:MerR family transcriptional regulator [Clostridia bacterium]
MKKYKIGDISKILNMPAQTIRFYEDHGIVRPEKDSESGYRYYVSWDLNNLMDCMYLRSLDFSLSQVERIVNWCDMDDICLDYMEKENELLKKIEEYKVKLNVLSEDRIRIQRFRQDMGKFSRIPNPALIYHRFRNNDVIESVNGYTISDGTMDEMHNWIRLLPLVKPTFMLQYHSGMEMDDERPDCWWGWSLPADVAVQRGIDALSSNEYLPPMDSIHAVFSSKVRGGFRDAFKEQVLEPILRDGYKLDGNPIGRLITRTHEDGEHRLYLETWVPIVSI